MSLEYTKSVQLHRTTIIDTFADYHKLFNKIGTLYEPLPESELVMIPANADYQH